MTSGQTKRGFTIVELLIVIVVIAILAAITIVAYNGIQNRAKNTQVVSAVNSYVKSIRAYYATNNNTVPMPNGNVQCFNGASCWSGADVTSSQTLRTELQKITPTIPAMPTGHAALVTSGTTLDASGGNYTGWYILYQVISINNDCPTVSGLRYLNGNNNTGDNLRNCRAALEF